MKITLIAKNIDFCIENLTESAKNFDIDMEVIDFRDLSEALNYNNFGEIVLIKSSSLNREIERDILIDHLLILGIRILNVGQVESRIYNKYSQQYKVLNYIKKHKYTTINWIPTFKFNSLEDLKKCKELRFPIIEKPDQGTMGIGVKKLNSFDEIESVSRLNVYQNFIPNNADYRVVCLGGKVLGIMKRIAKDGDFRNNVAQGGSIIEIKDTDIVKKLSNIALQVSSIFNLNLCGVDIIFDEKEKKYKFLEVNSLVVWKGFSQITGINVGNEIIKHCIDLYNRKNVKIKSLVQNYYDENFEHLGDKKFHYASRLYLFLKDNRYKKHLLDLQNEYIGINENETEDIIKNILNKTQDDNSIEYRNENDIRNDILKNYPYLGRYNRLLFKFLFSLKVYNKDISTYILKSLDIETLTEYYQKLYSNPEHLCKLSTLAINYLYNINHFLRHINADKIPKLTSNYFLKIAQSEFKNNVDIKNKYNLELYYYTHLIIGASKFYSEKIVENKKDYIKMIEICEKIIQENYFDINIDNKVEFLVCAKLLDYQTSLFKIIYSECKNSLSDIGNYLIDRTNKFSNLKNKNSFIQSEHRNILFIMAFKK